MKLKAFVLALALAPLSLPTFAGAVHLTTDFSSDFRAGDGMRRTRLALRNARTGRIPVTFHCP
jgi:hypothetical protein